MGGSTATTTMSWIAFEEKDHRGKNFNILLCGASSGDFVTIESTAGAGGFRTDLGDSSIANSWLHSLDGTGPKADLRVLSYDGSQDYIVAVPEPATVVLLGFGSVLSLLRGRKHTI